VEAIGHLDFVHGKIALRSTGNFQNELSLLLNQFSCRKLEFLQCSSEFLTRSEIALKVGHYDAELPVNNVQFHKILRHNFDSLSFEIDDNFIANSEEPAFLPILSMNRYNSLKWLSVNCGECYDSLMAFLDVIKENCPKLEALTIFVLIPLENDSGVPHVFDADDILNQILHAKGKLQEIVEECRSLTSRLKICSIVPMLYSSANEFSCDWINRAKTMDWFKDAIHKETVKQLGNDLFNICQLESKFTDGFLELDHKTHVYRDLPE